MCSSCDAAATAMFVRLVAVEWVGVAHAGALLSGASPLWDKMAKALQITNDLWEKRQSFWSAVCVFAGH